MNQVIRFCTAPDGVRIAYATLGEGPPLVKTANWLSHLEFDLESPVWRHWLRELSRDHQLLRYDERGCGLSDWDAAENSLEAWVRDLETVVDAAGLERFPLLGISQGGPVAITYAVRHPERVTHLILYGSYALGWMKRNTSPADRAQREAMITLTRHGWGGEVPAFREPFTLSFIPDATYEQRQWFDELQRITCSPENAVRLQYATGDVDVTDLLPRVTTPTLILHARGDLRCPFDEGRALAAGIPDSRFVSLDGRNHVLLEDEPAWPAFLREVRAFLGVNPAPSPRLQDTAAGALLPGSRLGRYELEVRLGEGGMGTVYRARDTRLERVVALKLIAGLADESARAKLGQEARAAAALNHPNICRLHEFEEMDDRVFLVMEYVDGTPLSEHGAEALSPETVRQLGRQIADALSHAHDRGIVHRDLKSANVMVAAGGLVKVLDFGIARRISAAATMTVTVTGSTVGDGITGTPAYMAPEALRGSLSDPRSDLWSLGVVLYELLAGGRPFTGDTTFDLSSAILRDAPPPLPAHVPADLAAVVMRCLEKDPASRYPHASDVAAALLPV